MTKKIATAVLFVMALSSAMADPIVTDSTSRSTTDSTSNSTTTVKSPPPTAVAPAITIINSDVCAVAVSGATQTQILGISFGATMTDKNCETCPVDGKIGEQAKAIWESNPDRVPQKVKSKD